MCVRMDNHNRSRKHAENVARLRLELGDDDDDEEGSKDDVDVEGKPSVDADDVEEADDLPNLSQSRYYVVIHLSHSF